MAIAVFDYGMWSTLYPEFGAVSEQRAALLFGQAGRLYLDNTDASPVADVDARLDLLNMLVAHLAALSPSGGQASGGNVGRVKSASEGSVRVEFDSGLAPGTAAWFAQTPYGFQYWQATKGYRSATYIPGCQPTMDPWAARSWRR